MKNRFLITGLLALGVAACGDDVQIVEPTPPPTPPVTATMAPASATVAVGNSVVFAVNASGGAAGAAATWTCASSNTGIATASTASAGCQATGVAAGGVTITAAVTKGSETINVGAQLTVTTEEEAAGEPAFIFISDIGDTDGVVVGNAEVTISIERGDQVFMQLSVLVDGVVVSTLPFGGTPAMAAPEDEPAAQAVHAFTLSFNSAEYNAVTGEPTYMNGEHTISAALMVVGSDEPIGSGVHTVEFGNDDGYVVTADLGDNNRIGDDGRRWYGGPDNGTIDITALPVSYSGASVTTVSANFCGGDETDAEAPYEFSFECENRVSDTDADEGVVGEMLVLSSAGESGMILDADDLPFPAFVDFVGPSESPIIVANPNGREMGWLNADVGLMGKLGTMGSAKDNWLVEGGDDTGGIGGYNMMLRMGEDLEKALEASPGSALPAESADSESYCAIASATDDLGNESERPDDDATCRAAPAGGDALVNHDVTDDADGMTTPNVYGYDATPDDDQDDVDDLSGQTLKFGVDTTVPTVEFADDYDDDNRHNEIPGAFVFEPEDDESNVGNSGLHATDGLQVGIRRRTASKTECLTIADDGAVAADAAVDEDCDNTAITDEDVTLVTGVTVAYYTLSGMAQDAAGNSSDAISHTFVYDNAAATATAPSVPGVIEAGNPFDGASFLNDDLSIRDYYGAANFAQVLSIGIGEPIVVDEFNASSLTYLNETVNATVNTYAGLQSSGGNAPTALSGATVAVRDQTQAEYTSMPTTFTVQDAPDADDGFPATSADGGFSYAFVFPGDATSYVGTTVCGIEECDDDDSETSLKIEVKASATESGTFSNPFEMVDFLITDINGVSWTVGSDASGTSGRIGGAADNARNRTWSYSMTLPGTMLRAATRPMAGGAATPMIRAIAVNDNNVGLLGSTVMPTFDTTAP